MKMGDGGNLAADLDPPSGFFLIFPDYRLFRRFALLEATTGKFPESTPNIISPALLEGSNHTLALGSVSISFSNVSQEWRFVAVANWRQSGTP